MQIVNTFGMWTVVVAAKTCTRPDEMILALLAVR